MLSNREKTNITIAILENLIFDNANVFFLIFWEPTIFSSNKERKKRFVFERVLQLNRN